MVKVACSPSHARGRHLRLALGLRPRSREADERAEGRAGRGRRRHRSGSTRWAISGTISGGDLGSGGTGHGSSSSPATAPALSPNEQGAGAAFGRAGRRWRRARARSSLLRSRLRCRRTRTSSAGSRGEVRVGFIRAGAEMIEANTFGANRRKLSTHFLDDRLEEIVETGVEACPGSPRGSRVAGRRLGVDRPARGSRGRPR